MVFFRQAAHVQIGRGHRVCSTETWLFAPAACPKTAADGPDGAIPSSRELMAAAVVVRSMLGVS